MSTSKISVQGARTHNLANISIDLPRNQLIVVTGLSGSGKSSLVFDTIYAEGQRRYVESLSAYARQFLSVMEKPEVDHISGLSPGIAIQQKTVGHNPRSTVGTVTEIYDYLRVLFARVGDSHCPQHGTQLTAQTITQMADHILGLPEGTRLLLLAPVLQNKKGEHAQLIERLKREGYLRIRWNGEIMELSELPTLSRTKHHTIEVVIDRLVQQSGMRTRLVDSLETTLKLSQGLAKIALLDEKSTIMEERVFSSLFACPECNYSAPSLDPRLFSFNNAVGACPDCKGLGGHLFSFSQEELPYLTDFFIFPRHQGESTPYGKSHICSTCDGERLCLEARHVFVAQKTLPQLAKLSLEQLQAFFSNLTLSGQREQIARDLLKEIKNRISFLVDVGLDYLTLFRAAETLSGGESQRIRLASQIGSGLVGVMYVLDEPSIGLHPRDNKRLLKTLDHLRDLGNTVIVVEHDEEAMRHADYLVDIGPGAGIHGGRIVAQGTPQEVISHSKSLTGQYLSGQRRIEIPTRTPINRERCLSLKNITENNLKSVNVEIPLGVLTCITGVSGSGKSTLINQALYPLVNRYLGLSRGKKSMPDVAGLKHLDKIIAIDQKPIGRTPRSNPATYIGVLDLIRELFAATPEARARGYKLGRFSFNVSGGRCSACEGVGLVKVEMHFLADIHVQCDLCEGRKYNPETLEIKYKNKNIHDVLSMTVEKACEFFAPIPAIKRKLKTLIEVGLDYITLGQSATTFSGGEAQRIKLAKELSRRDTGKTLYILDEPTTGLHFHDTEQLLQVLYTLRNLGNTILVIEHNLDVIKTADWIIDLGPEGGHKGGEIIAWGTPEEVANNANSYTGQYLKKLLENA